MGFLDNLFNKGSKAVDNAVKDSGLAGEAKKLFSDLENEATRAFNQTVNEVQKATGSTSDNGVDSVPAGSCSGDDFEDKVQAAIATDGTYELEKDLSISQLENELGREVYTRKNGTASPDNISFVIRSEGNPVLYIRYWKAYQKYNHAANREIKGFCDNNGIKMLDFFAYLPNEDGYVADRIQSAL